VNDGSAGDSLGCNALTNAAAVSGKIAVVYRGSCEFGIKALNAQNAGAIGVIVINNASGTMDMGVGANGAAVNIPVAMISNADGAILKSQLDAGTTVRAILGTKKDWIQSITVDALSVNSGDNQGYAANVTDGPVQLEIGQTYPINFAPGFQTQAYEIYFQSWIDYDQNGIFDTDELVYDQLTDGLGAINANVTIPSDAVVGSSRMRITMSYMGPGQTSAPSVCDQFGFGEVEDYCVEILPASGLSIGLKENNLIKLYPNPSSEEVTVNNGSGNSLEMKVLDLTGRTVAMNSIPLGLSSIETSTWNSGTYFYVLVNDQNEVVKSGKMEVIH
jgi:hypothetical protein